MIVYRGKLVHSLGPDKRIQVLEDHVIGVDQGGKIVFVEPASAQTIQELSTKHGFVVESVVKLTASQFLMPGLVDTHIHAPQYVNSGTGYDLMLLDWLNTYTFPTEARFKQIDFASDVYVKAVRRTLQHGTTTASYFGTIHLEATKQLCRVIEKFGQRALVGKVCMDQNAPDFYVEESTQKSLEDTESFIKFTLEMKKPLIKAVITPRFAPTCTVELMDGLGLLAKKYDLPIQTHIAEQLPEVEYTLSLFPQFENSSKIFESSGLLTEKTLMAHCIYLNDDELDLFQKLDVGICHCPTSNFNLTSGALDVRKLLERKMEKIGLGTDVSGGHSPSILSAIRTSIDASKTVKFMSDSNSEYETISHHHAFYMATLGGAKVLSLDDKIGNFMVGKEFDALLIDVSAPDPQAPVFDIFEQDSFNDTLTKFLYLGDDRNILKRFVAGREIML